MADRSRVIDCCPVLPSDEGALTRLPGAFCHHVHRAIQRNFRPLFRARRAISYFRLALRMSEQLIRRRTLWAKIPLANGTFRVALDRNQLPIFVINQLSTTHAAIWTNRARHFRSVDTSMHCTGLIGHRLQPRTVLAFTNLPQQWPFRQQLKHPRHLNRFRLG